MAYEFKKLGEVEAVNSIPNTAYALVEIDGAVRRVPAGVLASAPLVILPETELTKMQSGMFASVGLTELPAYPEVGMLYDVTMNGEAHTFPAIAAASMGMESMGDVLLYDQALPYGVIIAFSEKAEQTGAAVVVLNVDESWNPDTCVLSIKGKAETASAGGGGFLVNATLTPTNDEGTEGTCTFDKTFEETLAAIKAGQYVACHANVNGMYVIPVIKYSDSIITFVADVGMLFEIGFNADNSGYFFVTV